MLSHNDEDFVIRCNSVDRTIIADTKSNIWISASAGSGKTTMLVGRIIALLLDDIDPCSILCVTYTDNAAKEMRTRISNILMKWFFSEKEFKDDLLFYTGRNSQNINFEKVRNLFFIVHNIRIMTVHGFCMDVSKKTSYERSSGFKISITDDISTQYTRFTESCKIYYSMGNKDNLVFTLFNEESLRKLFFSLRMNINKSGQYSFDHYIQSIKNLFSIDDSTSDVLLQSAKNNFKQEAMNIACSRIDEKLSNLISNCRNIDNLPSCFKDYINDPYNIELFENFMKDQENKDRVFATLSSDVEYLLSNISDEIDKLSSYFYQSNILKTLLILNEIYNNLQEDKSEYDFDSIIANACKIIESGLWNSYTANYPIKHILVDEAQDLSGLQWRIIGSIINDLFSERDDSGSEFTFFVVGDIKQSIFGFQGSSPKIFMEMLGKISKKCSDFRKKMYLMQSSNTYRCGKKIVNLINNLLSIEDVRMSVCYENNIPDHVSYSGINGLVNFYKMHKDSCSYIADIIDQWISEGRLVTDSDQVIKFSDIKILIRQRGSTFDRIIKALNEKNIPYIIDTRTDNQTIENNKIIADLIYLGYGLINPKDKFSLMCMLRSSFFNMNDEDSIYNIFCKEEDFTNYLSDGDLILYKNLDHAIRNMNVNQFYCYALFSLNLIDRMRIFFGSTVDVIVTEWFAVLAKQENKGINNTYAILNMIDRDEINIKLPKSSFELSTINAVCITTVHGAKGQESPIIIMPDTLSTPMTNDEFVLSDDVLFLNKKEYCAQIKSDVSSDIKKEGDDEYLRLLYVAITRAKNELHIFGDGSRLSKLSWHDIISSACDEKLSIDT